MRSKLAVLAVLFTTAGVAGCGSTDTTGTNDSSSTEFLKQMEDGHFYVLTKNDNSLHESYFNNANFERGDTGSADGSQVMWFKDDYRQIPTVYVGRGDSLVYYTNGEIDENFTFDRFFDYGATFGLCGMEATESGRCLISTVPSDSCTYPGGDTDELLKLDNENVLLDSINGVPLRISAEDKEITFEDIRSGQIVSGQNFYLTPSGTLQGLKANETYPVDVYEGTKLPTEYTFKADVRAFGSYENYVSHDYAFQGTANVISITLPDFLNDGYYSVNGSGLFRLVREDSFNDGTDFNVPNEYPGEEDSQDPDEDGVEYDSDNNTLNGEPMSHDISKSHQFNVDEPGNLEINVTFSLKSGYSEEGNGLPDVTAILQMPKGGALQFNEREDGSLYLKFYAEETGTYNIVFYDLNAREPEIEIK